MNLGTHTDHPHPLKKEKKNHRPHPKQQQITRNKPKTTTATPKSLLGETEMVISACLGVHLPVQKLLSKILTNIGICDGEIVMDPWPDCYHWFSEGKESMVFHMKIPKRNNAGLKSLKTTKHYGEKNKNTTKIQSQADTRTKVSRP